MEPPDLFPDDPDLADRLASVLASRRDALRATARLAAGLVSAPFAVAALSRDAFGQDRDLPAVVVDVLNFALTLEELEAAFYVRGVAEPGLLAGTEREVFDQIRKHEVAHVQTLRAVLRHQAIATPTFDFTGGAGSGAGPFADVFSNPQTFVTLSQAFEDTGVRAYKGQASFLMGAPWVLEPALRIHAVEARHAARVRRLRGARGWITQDGRDGLPPQADGTYRGEDNHFHFVLGLIGGSDANTEAFDEPLTRGQVLDVVRPFLAA